MVSLIHDMVIKTYHSSHHLLIAFVSVTRFIFLYRIIYRENKRNLYRIQTFNMYVCLLRIKNWST